MTASALTKNQKRRQRKKRSRVRFKNPVPMPEPETQLTVRFAVPEDKAILEKLYEGYFGELEMDFSEPHPFWILVWRGEQVVAAIQLFYSKPISMIENLLVVPTDIRERSELIDFIFQVGFSILGDYGARQVFGFVKDDENKSWLNYLKKRGWIESQNGCTVMHEAI